MWDQVHTYFWPWLILISVSLILFQICRSMPGLGRRLFGWLFLLGGLANLYLAILDPREYLVFGQFTFSSSYRWFIYMILFRQAIWMGSLLALFHFFLAYQFIRVRKLNKISIQAAAILLLLLVPLGFGSAFPAPLILLAGLYHLDKYFT